MAARVGITRSDAGIFTDLRWARGDNDQLKVGIELRRRSYPEGTLRYRSRDIAEATASWTHAFADGLASFSLAAHGGGEFAIASNPYGDTAFVGLSPSFDVTLSSRVSVYAYGWWQHGRYNREMFEDRSGDTIQIGTRSDDLYEVGAGLLWTFAPNWETGPNILYIRDSSNVAGYAYSSTEVSFTLRRDF